MLFDSNSSTARDGDIAQLVGLRHKHFFITLKAGTKFETHRGIITHDELIGKTWGSQIFSHNGSPFFMLQPSLADFLNELPRATQILYPKDIGFILMTMSIGPGKKVIEAGTGSGSMTTALSYAVGETGKVISYENKADNQNLARKNLERVGLASHVDFKLRDALSGFDETDADAIFLDLPNPFDYVKQARAALKPGGHFSSLLPTFNQVEKLLWALRNNNFAFIDTCELFLRYYKPDPMRLRPTDRMVAHTGFLVFARRIEPVEDPRGKKLIEELGAGEVEAIEN